MAPPSDGSPFSDRSDVARATNAVTRGLEQARARGEVIDLTVSNPADAALPYDREALSDALADVDPARYAPHPLGMEDARRALARAGLVEDAERTLICASTSEAYAYLLRLLTDRGDEVLAPAPSYPLLAHLAHAADVQLVHYPLRFDGGWHASPAELFEAIGERTRALVTVSPNNPTGHYLDEEAAQGLSALDLPLIVDEVFRAYPLEAEPPPRARLEGLTFRLDGLSKRAALPGLKLGWVSVEGPDALVAEAVARLEVLADTFLSPNVPAQLALPALLRATAGVTDAIRARTRRNLAALRDATDGTAMSVPPVEAGWYACVRVPATRTDEAWCLALLERGVHAHPGYFYDFPDEEAWLVVSLLTPEAAFDEGVAILHALVG